MQIKSLSEDLNFALKARDQTRVDTLRMLLSELNYKKIELQKDLSEEDILGVIKKEAKKRREAIESFKMGGRQVQADQEAAELALLEAYLPKQLTKEEIKKQILEMGEIKNLTDFGQIMRVVAPRFKGTADGAMVAGVVIEILGQK